MVDLLIVLAEKTVSYSVWRVRVTDPWVAGLSVQLTEAAPVGNDVDMTDEEAADPKELHSKSWMDGLKESWNAPRWKRGHISNNGIVRMIVVQRCHIGSSSLTVSWRSFPFTSHVIRLDAKKNFPAPLSLSIDGDIDSELEREREREWVESLSLFCNYCTPLSSSSSSQVAQLN